MIADRQPPKSAVRRIVAADLFCGLGGTSEGLRRACSARGCVLDLVAGNHWDKAIEIHARNHPYARHFCADLTLTDPRELVPGGYLDLLCASPECTHHSNARGGIPRDEQSRATAWCVIEWCEKIDVQELVVENVPEFRTWGPLDEKGKRDKRENGRYFNRFVEQLRALGYTVEFRVLNCADYGDPQTRKRLFVRASKRGVPRWPPQTRCDPRILAKDALGVLSHLAPWRSAAEHVIDWTKESASMAGRRKELVENTWHRAYVGLAVFNGPEIEPWLEWMRRHMRRLGYAIPEAEIGSKRDPALSVVVPLREHGLARSVRLPVHTVCAGGTHLAHVEAVLVTGDQTGSNGVCSRPATRPVQTLVGKANTYLVEAVVVGHPRENAKTGRPASLPLVTVTARSSDFGIVEPVLEVMKGASVAASAALPAPTVTTIPHLATVEPVIVPHEMFDLSGCDPLALPLRTCTASNGRGNRLAEPVIVPFYSERSGQTPRSHHPALPAHTVTSHGIGGLVEAVLIDCNHGVNPGEAAGRRCYTVQLPFGAVTGSRGKATAIPVMVQYNGTSGPQSVADPMPSQSTKERHALIEPVLVEIDGRIYAAQVNFRMIGPDELAAAMSLGGYVIEGTLEDKTKLIGNAVPAATSEALCAAAIDALLEEEEDCDAA